jgi:hypothetical protein
MDNVSYQCGRGLKIVSIKNFLPHGRFIGSDFTRTLQSLDVTDVPRNCVYVCF